MDTGFRDFDCGGTSMKMNVGNTERVIRIVAGVVILSGLFWFPEGARWWAAIGVVPIATGLIRWCPAYAVLGLNTCSPAEKARS
jgi:hypothetical protein